MKPTAKIVTYRKSNTTPQTEALAFLLWGDQDAAFLRPKLERKRLLMYFISGSDQVFEQLMQTSSGWNIDRTKI
ncbi:hypothetical protein CLONEX_03504 [[Clostridium] nexile DSM 1787]|nr:hypothetical protein CLONEX_03504 [[Clostridium] nexile DSM 1787]